MKKDMTYIEILLEKYFEGQTSLQEENVLRAYFQQEKIAESLEKYRPIFNFFSEERGEELPVIKNSSRIVWLRSISIAVAAGIVLFLGVKFAFFDQEKSAPIQSMVYIDGKKYTDIQTIQEETLNTLDSFSATQDDVISSQIDMLNSLTDF